MKNHWIQKTLGAALAAAAVGLLAGCDQPTVAATAEKDKAGEPKWLTDYPQALKLAAEQKRPMLLDFTGSDWCPYCIQLRKEVFNTAEFQRYAGDHLILVELDFPKTKPQSKEVTQQNEKLQQQYRVEGFPTVILLGPDGKEVKRSEGLVPGGVKGFMKWMGA